MNVSSGQGIKVDFERTLAFAVKKIRSSFLRFAIFTRAQPRLERHSLGPARKPKNMHYLAIF